MTAPAAPPPVVFAGPSVEADALRAAFGPAELEVLPPVRRGDIEELFARERPPTHVGIVDGEFMQSLMISPKEIAGILEMHDVRFYGSSSIGALRAVELESMGMVGVGRVVELYRSRTTWADDEVAMVFDGESMRPLCEPMVNIRLALSDAVAAGAIRQDTADTLLAATERLYFPDRSYRAVLAATETAVEPEQHAAAAAFLVPSDAAARPDAKREDALALVRQIAADLDATSRGGKPA
jgi:hypothetical protein